jgi:glc operon protein GlcG
MKTTSTVGHLEAQAAIAAIQAELVKRGKAAVIAVADDHGELVALLRLDGAPFSSITIATNKAFTAARERKPSWELGIESRDPATAFDIAYYGDLRFVGWGGGVPIVVDGNVAGSVAVSGLTQEEDAELAALGAAAAIEASGATPASRSVASLPPPIEMPAGSTSLSETLRRMRDEERG